METPNWAIVAKNLANYLEIELREYWGSEERWIFAPLAKTGPDAAGVVAQMEQEHRDLDARLHEFKALTKNPIGAELAPLVREKGVALVKEFLHHMFLEEEVGFTLAEERLGVHISRRAQSESSSSRKPRRAWKSRPRSIEGPSRRACFPDDNPANGSPNPSAVSLRRQHRPPRHAADMRPAERAYGEASATSEPTAEIGGVSRGIPEGNRWLACSAEVSRGKFTKATPVPKILDGEVYGFVFFPFFKTGTGHAFPQAAFFDEGLFQTAELLVE